MPHTVERAPTGRAKCRACGASIEKGAVRVGEAVPNTFADTDGAEAMHWYHPRCAAYRRPEAYLQAATGTAVDIPDAAQLAAAATFGVAHHRVPRVHRAERAPSPRAACRACRTPIAKGAWRVSLLFWQDGRYVPAGFVHTHCAHTYFGTTDLGDRVRHATPDLAEADLTVICGEIAAGPPAASPDGPTDGETPST